MSSFFSSEKSEERYIGEILRELNSGKSVKSLLLEMNWKERAKLLLHLKIVKRCHQSFQNEMSENDENVARRK